MTDKYGLIKAKHELPPIELLRVPHKEQDLVVGTFGPNTYSSNVRAMQQHYSNSAEFPDVTFREPLTQESISAAAYRFGELAKPQIFDPRWLQAGRIVRTQEGVFTNTSETDQARLTALLNDAQKVNGIYLLPNSIAFAPYETFERGVQEAGKFAESGLARALEYTSEKVAPNLAAIAAKQFYPSGVNVWGFDSSRTPVSRVVCLDSVRHLGGSRLIVNGVSWVGYDFGCVFGVRIAEGDAQKIQ